MGIALRSLEPTEMLALSSRWLDEDRAALDGVPELKPLLPRLAEAHAALSAALPEKASGVEERLGKLSAEAREVDERHDHAVRSLYFAISAVIEHLLSAESPDIDVVTELEVLRDTVLPEGLSTTQATYEVEVAAAERAREAIASDEAAQKLLQRIHVLPKVTGLDLLSAWGELATRLGALELERASVAGGEGAPAQTQALSRARNGWLAIVATLLSVIDHSRAPADRLDLVRKPLQEASARAQQRAGKR